MPAMQSRSGSGRRRTINEINMVPFIDVMLVLLIIFMVSAPLMTPGVVDLPTIGQAQRQPDRVIEVIVDADGQLRLKVDGRTPAGSDQDEPALRLLKLLQRAAHGGIRQRVGQRLVDDGLRVLSESLHDSSSFA